MWRTVHPPYVLQYTSNLNETLVNIVHVHPDTLYPL
jgi:hypothetical protein